MSRYNKYLILVFISFFILACSSKSEVKHKEVKLEKIYKKVEYKEFKNENFFIMYALECERQKKFLKARQLYEELFKKTNNYEYFQKFTSLDFLFRRYKELNKNVKQNLEEIKDIKEEENILKLYVFSLVKEKDFSQALFVAKRLLDLSKTSLNYELLGNLYMDLKDYEKAHLYLTKANDMNSSLNLHIPLAKIEYFYLKKKEFAKQRLEKYIDENSYPFSTCSVLLDFYSKDKEKEKIFDLLQKAYKKTNKAIFLAQLAVFEFEEAKDKKSILSKVLERFEKIINKLDNPVYQNYYAYLLIDYDKDVKKGLALVKKALKKSPENIAYIDTLAWGQYKIKDCKNALVNMEKIIKKDIKEEEIQKHWDIIKKECK